MASMLRITDAEAYGSPKRAPRLGSTLRSLHLVQGPICLRDELTHFVNMEPAGIMDNSAGLTTWELEGTALQPCFGDGSDLPFLLSKSSLREKLVCSGDLQQQLFLEHFLGLGPHGLYQGQQSRGTRQCWPLALQGHRSQG